MRKANTTYRLLSVSFLLILLSTAFSTLYSAEPKVEKVQTDQSDDQQDVIIEASPSDAVVQAVKVDLDKKFFFVKNTLLSESHPRVYLTTLKVDLPKILQTLFVSAIPKNAP